MQWDHLVFHTLKISILFCFSDLKFEEMIVPLLKKETTLIWVQQRFLVSCTKINSILNWICPKTSHSAKLSCKVISNMNRSMTTRQTTPKSAMKKGHTGGDVGTTLQRFTQHSILLWTRVSHSAERWLPHSRLKLPTFPVCDQRKAESLTTRQNKQNNIMRVSLQNYCFKKTSLRNFLFLIEDFPQITCGWSIISWSVSWFLQMPNNSVESMFPIVRALIWYVRTSGSNIIMCSLEISLCGFIGFCLKSGHESSYSKETTSPRAPVMPLIMRIKMEYIIQMYPGKEKHTQKKKKTLNLCNFIQKRIKRNGYKSKSHQKYFRFCTMPQRCTG